MRFFRSIGTRSGWKTFAFEVAVIAVGVGIALTTEQLLSNYNKKKAAEAAFNNTKNDLLWLHMRMSERLAAAPCTRERIRTLGSALMEGDGQWTPIITSGEKANDQSDNIKFIPIHLSNWPYSTWQAAIASGAASNMPSRRFVRLSAFFDAAKWIEQEQNKEARLLGALTHLTQAGPMSFAERRSAYSMLGELEGSNMSIEFISREIKDHILTTMLDTPLTSEDIVGGRALKTVKDFISQSDIKKLYPSCYDQRQWDSLLDFLEGFVESPSVSSLDQ